MQHYCSLLYKLIDIAVLLFITIATNTLLSLFIDGILFFTLLFPFHFFCLFFSPVCVFFIPTVIHHLLVKKLEAFATRRLEMTGLLSQIKLRSTVVFHTVASFRRVTSNNAMM